MKAYSTGKVRMLSFSPEWHQAPGVKDPVLASTWARLEIQAVDDSSKAMWPSRVISVATKSVHDGVYGPLFPLAEWIVENWWFLLHEPCRVPELTGGRQLAGNPSQRAWAQRHNLLAAREGGALPDLTIYRDGGHVVARWVPDPKQDERIHPVRFIDEGEVRLPEATLEHCLHQLVEAVLDRLRVSTDADSERLRKNWKAICEARENEAELCAWAASIGLDAYDEREFSDALAEVLESRVRPLSAELRTDLLEVATAPTLSDDLDWLDQALPQISNEGVDGNGQATSHQHVTTAYELGYKRADSFRKEFDLPAEPILDLPKLVQERCGWPTDFELIVPAQGGTNLTGLVGKDPGGRARLIGPLLGHWASRFRLARAMFFLPDPSQASRPRLVTRAYTWDQRASRAFAAELLAPTEALRAAVGMTVSGDQIDQIAHEFAVSPALVEHQLKNHHVAWVEEF